MENIPSEVQSEIIAAALDYSETPWVLAERRRDIALISRIFHTAVYSNPRHWARLLVIRLSKSAYIDFCLQKAQQAHLTVVLDTDYYSDRAIGRGGLTHRTLPEFAAFLALHIRPSFGRVVRLRIKVPDQDAADVLLVQMREWEPVVLRYLQVDVQRPGNTETVLPELWPNSPCLTLMRLDGAAVGGGPFIFRTLTKLQLHDIWSQAGITWAELRRLFVELWGLRELSLLTVTCLTDTPHLPVTLPLLTHLVVDFALDACGEVTALIDAPMLQQFDLSISGHASTPVTIASCAAFLNRARRITVSVAPATAENWNLILRATKHVVEFDGRHGDAGFLAAVRSCMLEGILVLPHLRVVMHPGPVTPDTVHEILQLLLARAGDSPAKLVTPPSDGIFSNNWCTWTREDGVLVSVTSPFESYLEAPWYPTPWFSEINIA
ncbi:hypothetical protein B0H15DRAFT_944446 [Mycena belliarum]|uniref:Uncharacterized protein n=1 Tax=Mycena belliarum TaxID=1033014 RepID=A0AAD6UGY8_9AGAR|nr:hypothetical protein B0H15DRAFT_944446 [Mycena belliae]